MNIGLGIGLTARLGSKLDPNAYANKIIALFGSSLICYLRMSEASGAVAEDAGPEGNDAAISATGVTPGQDGIGDGRTSFLFDGSTGFLNLAASGFSADFNGAAGTLSIWLFMTADMWADGVSRYPFFFRVNASNNINIVKSSTAGRFDLFYVAGGTQKTVSLTSQSWTGWNMLTITWDQTADQVKFYRNGSQIGSTLTGMGTWSGTLDATRQVIGAAVTTPTNVWSNRLAHFVALNRAATPTEVVDMATLPFELATSTAGPSSARTIYAGPEDDITTVIATMRAGDTLELSPGATYTVTGNGLSGLPSGVSCGHTTIHGNGATISGGDYPLYLSAKAYIDIQDCTLYNGDVMCGFLINCNFITVTDCDFVSGPASVFYDVVRLENSNDCAFTCCTAAGPGRDTSDGFEMWGPCNRITFTDCTAYDMNNGGASDRHGFEVYSATAATPCSDITFNGCEAYGCNVGFSCEGGPEEAAHEDVICVSCSSHDNAQYGYQGIQGATLYRQGTPGDNSDNGISETFGTVTDL